MVETPQVADVGLLGPLAANAGFEVELPIAPIAAAVLSGLTALVAATALRRAIGTTLTAPFLWAIGAAAVIGATELLIGLRGAQLGALNASAIRFLAACAALCPGLAVLGAKRPQDRGWQWVVASMWVVLALPALQAFVHRAGTGFELNGMWSGFVVTLVMVTGPLNYTATRYGVAVWLFALGQLAQMAPALGGGSGGWTSKADNLALAGSVAQLSAALVAAWAWRRASRKQALVSAKNTDPVAVQNARWLRFRHSFGTFWELRVAQRVNQSARASGWPVRLEHNGFAAADTGGEAESAVTSLQAAQIRQALDAVLRRFERLEESGSLPT